VTGAQSLHSAGGGGPTPDRASSTSFTGPWKQQLEKKRQRYHIMWLRRLGLSEEAKQLLQLHAALLDSYEERNRAASKLLDARLVADKARDASYAAAAAEATSSAAQDDAAAERYKKEGSEAMQTLVHAEAAANVAERALNAATLALENRNSALARLEKHVSALEEDAAQLRRNLLQLRILKHARDATAARAARDYPAASKYTSGLDEDEKELDELTKRYGSRNVVGQQEALPPPPAGGSHSSSVELYSRQYDDWFAKNSGSDGSEDSRHAQVPADERERLKWLERLGLSDEARELQRRRTDMLAATKQAQDAASKADNLKQLLARDESEISRADAELADAIQRGAPAEMAKAAQQKAREARDRGASRLAALEVARAASHDDASTASARKAALVEYEAVVDAQERYMARTSLVVLDGAIARMVVDHNAAYTSHDFDAAAVLEKHLASRRASRARLIDAYSMFDPASASKELVAQHQKDLKDAAVLERNRATSLWAVFPGSSLDADPKSSTSDEVFDDDAEYTAPRSLPAHIVFETVDVIIHYVYTLPLAFLTAVAQFLLSWIIWALEWAFYLFVGGCMLYGAGKHAEEEARRNRSSSSGQRAARERHRGEIDAMEHRHFANRSQVQHSLMLARTNRNAQHEMLLRAQLDGMINAQEAEKAAMKKRHREELGESELCAIM
jgi:hypothetical protein